MGAEGNQESVEKAKSILTSTLTSIVILFAGYILLKAINPDLIEFQSIKPPIASVAPIDDISTTAPGVAGQLITLRNLGKITISNSGSCPANNPLANIQAIALGQLTQKDGPGLLCNQGTTGINPDMLQSLVNIANTGTPITITSLTSGHHSTGSAHYSGNAVDFIPQNPQGDGQKIINAMIQRIPPPGGSSAINQIAVECTIAGVAQYIVVFPSNTPINTSACTGQPNYHWHAQWR
jgi:hypothetical protein